MSVCCKNCKTEIVSTEALEQQTATSKILGVIASSPTDLQPVMDAVAENAARVCGATDALIVQIEGDCLKGSLVMGRSPRTWWSPRGSQELYTWSSLYRP